MTIVRKAVEYAAKKTVFICNDVEGLWIGTGTVWFFVPGAPKLNEGEFKRMFDIPDGTIVSEDEDALSEYSLNHVVENEDGLQRIDTAVSWDLQSYLSKTNGLRFIPKKVMGCFTDQTTVFEREGPGGMRHLVFKDGMFVCGAMRIRNVLTEEILESLEEFVSLCRETLLLQRAEKRA